MPRKKQPPARKPPFSFHFDEGMRDIAERRAEADYRGNITAYLNDLVKVDGRKNKAPDKR